MVSTCKTILILAFSFSQILLARPNPPQSNAQSIGMPLDPRQPSPVSVRETCTNPQSCGAGYIMYMLFYAMDKIWQIDKDAVIKRYRSFNPPLGQGFGSGLDLEPTTPKGELTISNSLWALIGIGRVLGNTKKASALWFTPNFEIRLINGSLVGRVYFRVFSATNGAEQSQAVDPGPLEASTSNSSTVTEVTKPERIVSTPASTNIFLSTTPANMPAAINYQAVFQLLLYTIVLLILGHQPKQPLNGPGGGLEFLPGVSVISPVAGTGEFLTIDIASQEDVPPGSYQYKDLYYGLTFMLYEMHQTFGSRQWYEYQGEVRKTATAKPFAKFAFNKPDPVAGSAQAPTVEDLLQQSNIGSAQAVLPSDVTSACRSDTYGFPIEVS